MKPFLLSVLGGLFAIGMTAHAQEPESDSEDSVESKSRQQFIELLKSHYHNHASAYVLGSGNDQSKPFRMEEKPILTWTSTGDAIWSGDVFVWTSDGRPQVIGCVGSWPIDDSTRGVFEELHSLSTQPLAETTLDSSLKWRSETAGVELKDIPDAAAPANDARRRLSQMRRLTDRFKASMAINNGTEELRLLTQPLFRYSGESRTVIDGAIFAYVTTTGTDPEGLLLLECHKAEDRLNWVYAPARFTHRELWLTLDDSEVWRVANHRTPRNNAVITDPYLTRPTDPVSIDDLKRP